jgi:YggT family protein
MITNIIAGVLQIYTLILLARVIMSWIPNLDYSNPIVNFLFQATEPVLKPVRDALPQGQGIDFSPIVVFIGIMVLQNVLYLIAI